MNMNHAVSTYTRADLDISAHNMIKAHNKKNPNTLKFSAWYLRVTNNATHLVSRGIDKKTGTVEEIAEII